MANMPSHPLPSLMFIWCKMLAQVGCLEYLDSKHSLTTIQNLFMLSLMVDPPMQQQPNILMVAMHFCSMDKLNWFATSYRAVKYIHLVDI